jgi:hypothetical protein
LGHAYEKAGLDNSASAIRAARADESIASNSAAAVETETAAA